MGIAVEVVREQQRLALEIRSLGEWLRSEMSKSIDQRNHELEIAKAGQLSDAEDQYDKLSSIIKQSDPRYANLLSPEPLTAADIQSYLNYDETLIVVHLGGLGSSVFAIEKEHFNWRLVEEPEKIARQVAILRCGRRR